MLIFQDPTNRDGTYLLESLAQAFESATAIRGMYAFASSAGIRLLSEDRHFRQVARLGSVELIIGTDAVTNVRAIDALANVGRTYPAMTARAFLNQEPRLFHPKFCFVKYQNGGRLIAGSGNLTEGGLLGHWEGYAICELDEDEYAHVEDQWDRWTERYHDWLLPLDDPRVRERAADNTVLAREGDLPTLVAPGGTVEEEPEAIHLIPGTSTVLVAEIPRSDNRWNQANFDLDNYENFFGAREDAADRMIILRHVDADGTKAEYEAKRPPVTVKSRNFRFELAAARGLPYPAEGRPIGVFIRMAGRTFFYRLLLPDDLEYEIVRDLLEERAGPDHAPNRMRRERMTVDELRAAWPNSPFWRLPPTT